jgi:hypothetical protein
MNLQTCKSKAELIKRLFTIENTNTHLAVEPVEVQVFVEVQVGETPTSLTLPPNSSSHLSLSKSTSYLGSKPLEWCSSVVLLLLGVLFREEVSLPSYIVLKRPI